MKFMAITCGPVGANGCECQPACPRGDQMVALGMVLGGPPSLSRLGAFLRPWHPFLP